MGEYTNKSLASLYMTQNFLRMLFSSDMYFPAELYLVYTRVQNDTNDHVINKK